MGRGSNALGALIGAVVFWMFVWLFFVGILSEQGTVTTAQITVPSTAVFQHLKWIRKERHHHIHQDLHINYVSKRRVPNGPDPIHNRRASQSRQPTGRS